MEFKAMRGLLLLAGLAVPLAASAEGMSAEEMSMRAQKLGIPADTVQLTPCVPNMGEHWARLQDMPFGPIYGAKGEQILFVEVMIAQNDFENGKSWQNVMQSPAGNSIDHVDIHFESHGHEGYEIPHYDIHAYYIGHDQEKNIC